MKETLFRIETTCGEHGFVDWYLGETEAAAIAVWDEDCHRYGLPMDKVTKTVRPATASEIEAYEMP